MFKTLVSIALAAFLIVGDAAQAQTKEQRVIEAFLKAVSTGDVAQARRDITAGIDVNLRLPNGMTPLFYAASFNKIASVKLLIRAGAKVNYSTPNGDTVLMAAAARAKPELLQLLIDRGADIKAENRQGHTALFRVISSGSKEKIDLLLDRGMDINHLNKMGSSVLFYATSPRYGKIYDYLVSRGALDNIKNNKGDYPWRLKNVQASKLLISTINNPKVSWQEVVDAGVDINSQGEFFQTLLTSVADKVEDFRPYTEKGANLDLQNLNGMTALMIAVDTGNLKGMKSLVELGANLDVQGPSSGETALHYALRDGHTAAANYLLSQGASTSLKGRRGETAKDLKSGLK